MRKPANRTLWIAGLLLALLVAGVGSWFASSSPDGLEWTAEETGFGQTAEDSVTAGSPLADYTVDGAEGRVPGSVAGVVGVGVTLVLAGGLTLLLRRRATSTSEPATDPAESVPAD